MNAMNVPYLCFINIRYLFGGQTENIGGIQIFAESLAIAESETVAQKYINEWFGLAEVAWNGSRCWLM